VIERFSASLNPKALGYDLTVIVEVKAENERADLLDEMQRRFAACPQVQQCYYVAGAWDFVLIFLVHPSSTPNGHFSRNLRVGTLRINNLGVSF
jgi:DNA-binding Lrp family transcriptional regulator